MSRNDLRKQAALERTRIGKLQTDDVDRSLSTQEFSLASWMPTIAMAMLLIFGLRTMSTKKSPVVQAPVAQVAIPAATLPDPPRERVTEERVQQMLWQVNGEPPNIPRPVATASTSDSIVDIPAAATHEMVNVKGQWLPKSDNNIYRVKGETIYHDKGKKK